MYEILHASTDTIQIDADSVYKQRPETLWCVLTEWTGEYQDDRMAYRQQLQVGNSLQMNQSHHFLRVD